MLAEVFYWKVSSLELRKDHADIQGSLAKITHLLLDLDKKVTNYLDLTPQIQHQLRLRQADATRNQHPAYITKEDNHEEQMLPRTANTEVAIIDDAEHEYKTPSKRSEPQPTKEKQMVPITQYHPHYQPTRAEIDLNPESVFTITPTTHHAHTPVLQHQMDVYPNEPMTDSTPKPIQVQSPAKRREYSISEEVHLDKNKEQKDPKRKNHHFLQQKMYPKYSSSPFQTTLRLHYHSTILER